VSHLPCSIMFHAVRVLTFLGGDPIIYVLNTYAGVFGLDSNKGSRNFATAFSRFMKALEACGFDET